MPIYEYVCKKCDQQFEALVRGDEKPECPHCGSTSLAKQMSLPAAHSQSSDPGCQSQCGVSRPLPT